MLQQEFGWFDLLLNRGLDGLIAEHQSRALRTDRNLIADGSFRGRRQRRKWNGTLVTTMFGRKRSDPLMSSARWLWKM